ncbi:EcoAI/FtnUII family type I restriction enzme subunit R [[Clostridium] scindens]|uniref:EcoAI/FtnUII family type I restriction enzme subunit R n=1 Tax=Clostridium scindens (strain JCM 10418 / VPI 12708) TaxID=29347 RepID=UPI001D0696B3|nr:DEAD/DEAH box helicase family protein [[Clostridium] scindens]MCB6287269.1 DEAD/DEAH box helicase family protein [[Clostridium] scindens]MCB6421962.1 DEAD/DEAH box helicase family protein [[Clostridium] scindens]MCB7193706.1 DEAD/DEAH box helicase family protein [[Clostridium] scindens]MCB7286775.1 DEAD/DEAH box helicase family protein [[Clostridium] scindens]MCG4930177.1 DEAD/DEAH box helicase family protein [[Clostridium] scindens]
MSTVLPKKQMSEEDIKLQYITPAITSKWDIKKITMETQVTDGRINLKGNFVFREKPKRADYLLYLNANNPIAVIEAKDNNHSISHGLQQAMTYAQMLDLPFAFSSNGDGFAEHDFLTGTEREFALGEFPTEDELIARYKQESGMTPAQESVIQQPYYSSQNTYSPRYYQRIAINRTVDAIAKGQDRILLVMATGTGKTYTAFQIVYRMLQSGMKRKILYLADRNILVDQSIQQDFAPLEKVIHKINVAKDDKSIITSHQVYFSLYQQLVGDDDKEHFSELFTPDFFDLIIVDECHRGSAKEESRWRRILEYFNSATQIGMTATPKETRYISNTHYFGDPIYTYSLKEGIEDGFLAPFKVINVMTDIGDGWRPLKGQRDKFGNPIEDRIYTNNDYDYNIVIEDRIQQVAAEITHYLKSTDRMSKTIVFCATEDAAERMRQALVNQNADMVKENPDYVVRITGSDDYGKKKLDYFISVSEPYPVIATTSKLLSTGADCKMTKLIVLDEMIGSMTEFKQIIGRGTRLREKEGKTHFIVMDFRNVSRLFADPDWDGPIEVDPGFTPGGHTPPPNHGPEPGPIEPPGSKNPKPIVDRNGCKVEIIHKTVSVYDINGKLLRQESIVDYTKENVRGEYASLDNFIQEWRKDPKKENIKNMLLERGIDLEMMKSDQGLADIDDFDFICHVAFDKKPLSRKERANNVKKRDFLSRYSGVAREVLEALLDKYMNSGIYEIEKTEILKLDPFLKMGKPAKIAGYFGGKAGYLKAVQELEEAIYQDEAV